MKTLIQALGCSFKFLINHKSKGVEHIGFMKRSEQPSKPSRLGSNKEFTKVDPLAVDHIGFDFHENFTLDKTSLPFILHGTQVLQTNVPSSSIEDPEEDQAYNPTSSSKPDALETSPDLPNHGLRRSSQTTINHKPYKGMTGLECLV